MSYNSFFIITISFLFFILTGCSISVEPSTIVFRLSGVEIVVNNSVGNEWGFTISNDPKNQVDKRIIITESSTYIHRNATVTYVFCMATEFDKYNDSNSKMVRIDHDQVSSEWQTGFTDLRVREEHGRYAGNYAIVRFTFEYKLADSTDLKNESLIEYNN